MSWPLLGGSCPVDVQWHYYSGTNCCYYVSTTGVDQSTARVESQQMGAELVSITDVDEMKFVNSIALVMTFYF